MIFMCIVAQKTKEWPAKMFSRGDCGIEAAVAGDLTVAGEPTAGRLGDMASSQQAIVEQ
jgi:hypothetical protein